jgi:hypothetical protein
MVFNEQLRLRKPTPDEYEAFVSRPLLRTIAKVTPILYRHLKAQEN